MQHHVIVQLPDTAVGEFEVLLDLEREIEQALGALATVDGHDSGSGTCNIFLFTVRLDEALDCIKVVLARVGLIDQAVIAVNETAADGAALGPERVVWPVGFNGTFSVLG